MIQASVLAFSRQNGNYSVINMQVAPIIMQFDIYEGRDGHLQRLDSYQFGPHQSAFSTQTNETNQLEMQITDTMRNGQSLLAAIPQTLSSSIILLSLLFVKWSTLIWCQLHQVEIYSRSADVYFNRCKSKLLFCETRQKQVSLTALSVLFITLEVTKPE